jgi:GPI ethanolamine phosphate transferase 3 subunit O
MKSILFFSLLFFIGIYTFINGFFLTRYEIENKNKCQFFNFQNKKINNCQVSNKKRIIWFLIDGLRFDFLKNESKVYQNHFPFLFELLKKENSILYKFLSDAPTTTSQRLKGLLCGNLPTFLDAGKNFDSDLLHSDNLIHQMKVNNKTSVILGKSLKIKKFQGDDTWGNLFKSSDFSRSRLFPAFNVKDLDTVDNGIMGYLETEILGNETKIEELYKNETKYGESFHFRKWDFLVAHFLGVDHAGHRYGIYHPRMYEKLRQMNSILELIVSKMDNETVLMLFVLF